MGGLVRWVAGIRASLHAKLMAAFLIVTLLFIAMAVVSVRTVLETTAQSRQLDQAHQRVAWAQQIEQALARQMHFSVLALLSQDEAAIAKILRENNRFNETLAKLDDRRAARAARPGRADPRLAGRGDVGGRRHGERDPRRQARRHDARTARRAGAPRRGDRGARRQLVDAEQSRMARLRDGVAAANRDSLVTQAVFAVGAVVLAWLCGFVISWSFIVPVREAQVFLDEVAAGNFSGRIAVRNRRRIRCARRSG